MGVANKKVTSDGFTRRAWSAAYEGLVQWYIERDPTSPSTYPRYFVERWPGDKGYRLTQYNEAGVNSLEEYREKTETVSMFPSLAAAKLAYRLVRSE